MPDDGDKPGAYDKAIVDVEKLEVQRGRVVTRPTVKLDPMDLTRGEASWPFAFMALERLAPWAGYAFKLGALALLQECIREMALPGAGPDLVVRARELIEALAHMQWEGSSKRSDP